MGEPGSCRTFPFGDLAEEIHQPLIRPTRLGCETWVALAATAPKHSIVVEAVRLIRRLGRPRGFRAQPLP